MRKNEAESALKLLIRLSFGEIEKHPFLKCMMIFMFELSAIMWPAIIFMFLALELYDKIHGGGK